jgi:hypothetical protein
VLFPKTMGLRDMNFLTHSKIFSEEYQEYERRRDLIRGKVLSAIEEIKNHKYTLYGKNVDFCNPEELIAYFYLLAKNEVAFKEN